MSFSPCNAIAAVVLTSLCSPPALAGEAIVFRDVRVFDGRKLIAKTSVIVEDGLIAKIGEKVTIPDGARIIDGQGHTLLPGLIDCHTHTFAEGMLEQALIFGVTTELDMFTSHQFAAVMRAEQKAGAAAHRADLLSAGTLVTAPGGHGTEYGLVIPTITKPEEAQAFVDARVAEGSDYIKLVYDGGASMGMSFPSIDKETLAAVVKAAHARGKLAVVHAMDLQSARDAVEAGADGLVHVFADKPIDEDFVKLARKRGAFVIPTLTVIESCSGKSGGKALLDDPGLKSLIGTAEASNLSSSFPASEGCNTAHALGAVGKLYAARVPILCGTDAPNPGTAHGASMHREMELLVEAGLTPAQALAAATSSPAERLKLGDRGTIAPGKRADLVLVQGDPTSDIKATRNLVGVWKGGRRADLDARRETVREQQEDLAEGKTASPPPGSESGLVSDFEEDLEAQFGADWMTSTDSYVGGKSKAEFRRVEGGSAGSRGALTIAGEIEERPQPRWAGTIFFPGTGPMVPANLSSKKALSFWARGDGKVYNVMIFTQSRGFNPSFKTFTAGPDWQQQRYDLSAFDGCDGSDIMGLFFGGGNDTGKFEFRIDDVRFE